VFILKVTTEDFVLGSPMVLELGGSSIFGIIPRCYNIVIRITYTQCE